MILAAQFVRRPLMLVLARKEPFPGQLGLPPGQTDALVAFRSSHQGAGNLAPLKGIGEVERQGPVIASRDLLHDRLAVTPLQIPGKALGVIFLLEFHPAVLAMYPGQRFERPHQAVAVAVVDRLADMFHSQGMVQHLRGGGIKAVYHLCRLVPLVRMVQIKAARPGDSLKIGLDPLPLLPGARRRVLEPPRHRGRVAATAVVEGTLVVVEARARPLEDADHPATVVLTAPLRWSAVDCVLADDETAAERVGRAAALVLTDQDRAVDRLERDQLGWFGPDEL